MLFRSVKTLGKDFEKTFDVFFDYALAVETLAFYESELIPKIDVYNVPAQLSNVRFDSDLTELQPIKKLSTKSLLHRAIL